MNCEIKALKDEVLKVVLGQSQEEEVLKIQGTIRLAEQVLRSKKVEQVEIQALQTYIPVWREVFKKASTAKKKMMLSTIIEWVRVYRASA